MKGHVLKKGKSYCFLYLHCSVKMATRLKSEFGRYAKSQSISIQQQCKYNISGKFRIKDDSSRLAWRSAKVVKKILQFCILPKPGQSEQ